MRAAQLVAYEKDLQVQQADTPVITDPHDAIVRVGGAGFCRADIRLSFGQLDATQKGARIDLPFTASTRPRAGVTEVGLGVTHVRVGDSVLLHPQSTGGYCRVY